ncbi:hypothetical protein AGMMS49546_27150 [Spirochaetia bacterium]|nr:hypothetical protein AGMMS49546_27150 [Spirochaetia bacterium]
MLISIIIPTYNSEGFIEKTLEMLLSQGLDDCEIIIIDDGSTDNTHKICKRFIDDHHNMRFINIPHAGVSAARNTGVKNACGEYVYFFDSDDALTPNSMSEFKNMVRKNNLYDIYAFGCQFKVNDKIKKSYSYPWYNNRVFSGIELLYIYLEKKISFLICSLLIRRELLIQKNILFMPGVIIGEDVEFTLLVLSYAQTIYYTSKSFFIYQIRNDSTSKGYKTYSIERFDAVKIIENRLLEIYNRYQKLLLQINFFMANLYTANLYFYLRSTVRDAHINQLFIEYKQILRKKSKGEFRRLVIFACLRMLPIYILLRVFSKYK